MKNTFKFVAVLLFVLLNALFVCGQRKIITPNEFYSATSAAFQKQYNIAKRVETVSETYAGGNVTEKTTVLYEALLPNRYRYVRKEQIGDKVTESESIRIDNFLYERENGGAWTKTDLSKGGTGGGNGIGDGNSYSVRQVTVEQTFLNNFSAKLYEMINVSESNMGLSYAEEKRWVSDEGFLLRSESSKGLFLPRTETSKTVTTYEYNPSDLKIEAPVK